MMNAFVLFSLGLILGSGFVACSKQATSNQPNYIYKSAPQEGLVARIAGEDISYDEAFSGLENEIFEAEMKVYEIKENRIRAMIVEKFMSKDPRKENLSNDEFLVKYVANNITIADQQIDAFVKEREIPAEHVNDQMKQRIREYLENEQRHGAVEAWIAEKTAKEPVEIYLNKPSRPVFEVEVGDAPIMGGKNARVTIVEFSDFQCPFCARGANVMTEVKKKYGDKVKVAFKNFPLPFHHHARSASTAGLCVHEQKADLYWKMHDLMFEDQQGLEQDGLIAKARTLNIDMDKFTDCLTSGKFDAMIDQDIEQGQKLGVKSTPTFFVNGMMVTGAQPLEEFSKLIDQELSK
jgi:protein-disulfide isomerase